MKTNNTGSSNKIIKLIKTVFAGLGYFLGGLLILASVGIVLLLPTATAVPAWNWIVLGIVDLGCIFIIFGRGWRRKAFGLAGMLLVGVAAVAASQFFAETPPILDAEGYPVPGSIATLEKIDLNGSQQWVSIRGKDADKPVLLFLAGGPGGSQLVTARRALGGLEDDFVVVNWEQPGSGKSFGSIDRSTLTPERYISDGIALVRYLQERFDEDKVYLLGESWGSALGVWMVQREPDLFHAFIGTGQMVAFLENDLICYKFVLELANDRGNEKKIEQLINQGPPPYYGNGVALKEAAFLTETFSYMNADPAITGGGFNTFEDLAGPEYGLIDKVNWFRGALNTLGVVYPQLWEVDFREQAVQLDVPVYFLLGRHDVNAPPILAEQYYEVLEAPHKEIIWFESSGHNPWVNESDRFV